MLRTLKSPQKFCSLYLIFRVWTCYETSCVMIQDKHLQMTLYLMWRRGVSPKLFSPFGVWTKIEKYLSEFLIQTNWVYPHYYDFSTKRLTDALGINECTTRAIELRNKRGFFHPKMCPLNKTFWDIFSKYFVLFF